MTDSEIIALALRYYKAGRASTAEADGIPTRDEVIASRLVLAIRAGCVARVRPFPRQYFPRCDDCGFVESQVAQRCSFVDP
jgi:hypothetical protein